MEPINENEKPESSWLDDEFPSGDGFAEDTADVTCPHCGQPGTITLDPGSGPSQEYVEDCPVCCRPWEVVVRYRPDGSVHVELGGES